MEITLLYGNKKIPLTVDDNTAFYPVNALKQEIDVSRFKKRLSDFFESDRFDLKKVIIIVADQSRRCDYDIYLPPLVESLLDHGAEKKGIMFYIAYGTHAPQSDAVSLSAYGPIFKDYPFIHHDCHQKSAFEFLGQTQKGTKVHVLKKLLRGTCVITFGAISHHYFAGYGGGRKLIFPGLGYKDAIYQNHSLFLDQEKNRLHRMCQPGILKGNPLAEDLFDYEDFFRADLSIHGMLDGNGRVCDLMVGKGHDHFIRACRIHGRSFEISEKNPLDWVIASCGGAPKDINFIQSHKSIHNAVRFLKDQGTLLIFAQCPMGIGSNTFLKWFDVKGWGKAFSMLSKAYEGNGGTALSLMEKCSRFRILMVTELESTLLKKIGIEKISLGESRALIKTIQTPKAIIPNAGMLVNVH